MRALDFILRLLSDHPWLWLVLVAWIAGVVGNIAKGKQRQERAETRRQNRRIGRPGTEGDDDENGDDPAPAPDPARSDADVAREMRRILGIEEPEATPPPPPPPVLAPKPRRVVVEPERAPIPVLPTAGNRHLPMHVDPHVGEAIGKRAVGSGRVGEHAAGKELGSLGGRSPHRRRAGGLGNRYELDDLKRILVLNEILGPPLALRPERRD